nr:hypothetical protein [Psychrobacter sp. WY6]
MYFDDVRPEEYTPSYAGAASRTDFLLKKEQIIIELKKSRKIKRLERKKLANNLLLTRNDIRYIQIANGLFVLFTILKALSLIRYRERLE